MGVPKMNSNNMVQSVILFLKILLTSDAAHWILTTNYRWYNYWARDPVEKSTSESDIVSYKVEQRVRVIYM